MNLWRIRFCCSDFLKLRRLPSAIIALNLNVHTIFLGGKSPHTIKIKNLNFSPIRVCYMNAFFYLWQENDDPFSIVHSGIERLVQNIHYILHLGDIKLHISITILSQASLASSRYEQYRCANNSTCSANDLLPWWPMWRTIWFQHVSRPVIKKVSPIHIFYGTCI